MGVSVKGKEEFGGEENAVASMKRPVTEVAERLV
jgi:hypothetical protein